MPKFLVEVDPSSLDYDDMLYYEDQISKGTVPAVAIIIAESGKEAFKIAKDEVGVMYEQTYIVTEVVKTEPAGAFRLDINTTNVVTGASIV